MSQKRLEHLHDVVPGKPEEKTTPMSGYMSCAENPKKTTPVSRSMSRETLEQLDDVVCGKPKKNNPHARVNIPRKAGASP